MVWLWRNNPGELHLKIKSSGRHWKELITRLEQLAGENCISNHLFEHGWPCHGHTIKMNSPDCFVFWFHVEMRCSCTASPSRKVEFVSGPLPQFPDLAGSTTLTLGRSWFQVGKGREIFKKHLKSIGHEAPSAFSAVSCRTTFFFFCYLLASKVWWTLQADNNSMQSKWCLSVFLKIEHFHGLIFQETTNYHFDPFRIKL